MTDISGLKKGFWIYAIALTILILATPLIAGVLNTFKPGETISSSQVNSNFSSLQDQFTNLCNQTGQTVLSAKVDVSPPNATLAPSFFSCNDAAVGVSRVDVGEYKIEVEGLNPTDEVSVLVTSHPFNATTVNCNTTTNATQITVFCSDPLSPPPYLQDSPFSILLVRR